MEQWIVAKLGAWSYLLVPIITGIITSFGTESVNLTLEYFGKKIHPKWIVVLISAIIAALLTKVLSSLYDGFWEYALAFIANIFVAIPFYAVAGKFTVDAVFGKYRTLVKSKIDENIQ